MADPKLYKKPTREGLWHPVVKGVVQWPVHIEILPVYDPETGAKTRKRIVSAYTFGTEERRDVNDSLDGYRDALWLKYRDPKLPKVRPAR